MISGAAFCPHPPLLVPAVASGAAAELAGLRAACRTAITRIAAVSDRLVLVGAGERTVLPSPSAVGTMAGFGVDVRIGLNPGADGPAELPLSLTVGAELVDDAIGDAVPRAALSVAAAADEPGGTPALELLRQVTDEGRVGLIVLGDGSARLRRRARGAVR